MKCTLGIAALLAAIAIGAEAQQIKPETQIKLRQSAYALMNSAVLATLVARRLGATELLPALAAGETRAKPEIWTKRADFDAKMDKLGQETSKLPQAARADQAALKKQMNDVEGACKACHDDYRVKKN